MTIARRPGEPLLGNPDADGKVLSSTTAGVRSWATPVDQAHRDAVTGVHGIVVSQANSLGLGSGVLAANTAQYNTAVGFKALESVTSGQQNTALGYYALRLMTTSAGSAAFGSFALQAATGARNSALGQAALFACTSGYYNTGVGYGAAQGITTGHNIVAIGHDTARYLADGTTANQTANNSVYVGNNIRASVAGATNETVIGNAAIGGGSNTVRLGNTAVTHWLPGATNVCHLGNATTAFKGLYLSDGTDEYLLTVNTSGALVIAKQ